jgi:hypothetical protein
MKYRIESGRACSVSMKRISMNRETLTSLAAVFSLVCGCAENDTSKQISRDVAEVGERVTFLESRIDSLEEIVTAGQNLSDHYAALREEEMRNRCIANQRVCEGAVSVFMADNDGNLPESLGDLVGEYLRTIPSCPKGGEYQFNRRTGSVTCNLREHHRNN